MIWMNELSLIHPRIMIDEKLLQLRGKVGEIISF